jgi:hypothetical protein
MLGFGVQGSGCEVRGSMVNCMGFGVYNLELKFLNLRLKIQDLHVLAFWRFARLGLRL